MNICCKNVAERLRFAKTNSKKITAFLRTTIDSKVITKDNNCQNRNEKHKPSKMVELVGFTVVPKIKSWKPIIIGKDN